MNIAEIYCRLLDNYGESEYNTNRHSLLIIAKRRCRQVNQVS